MHRKGVFAIAAVFLAVALVAPPVILITQERSELDALIRQANDPTHQTGTNTTFLEQYGSNRQTLYIIIAVIEIVFVSLFLVTAWIGINHYHGELDEPKKRS
jgi:hypothetical protein